MLNKEQRKKYEEMATQVALGRSGYQAANKSRLSKSSPNKFGPAPDFL